MTREEMDRLIEEHLAAEKASDPVGSVAMYTDDVIHDVVGSPPGALEGPEAAKRFYEFLTANIHTEEMDVNHANYGEDFCVIEHQWHGTVPGEFMGIPGHGRRIPSGCSTSGSSTTARSRARTSGSTPAQSSSS
jgi:hypothetical protein